VGSVGSPREQLPKVAVPTNETFVTRPLGGRVVTFARVGFSGSRSSWSCRELTGTYYLRVERILTEVFTPALVIQMEPNLPQNLLISRGEKKVKSKSGQMDKAQGRGIPLSLEGEVSRIFRASSLYSSSRGCLQLGTDCGAQFPGCWPAEPSYGNWQLEVPASLGGRTGINQSRLVTARTARG
jgi:hypothetical protein